MVKGPLSRTDSLHKSVVTMKKPRFKILSIDGGGIRGILPCTILTFIEDQLGRSISNTFDLISGTSTGGIISMGLSMPNADGLNAFSAADMRELYVHHGSTIFGKRQKNFLSRLGSITSLTKMLSVKPYEEEAFEILLDEYFANIALQDALTDVLVTSYEIERGKPFYFSSRIGKLEEKENFLMKDVARSTSAAPTYFEPSVVRFDESEKLALVDGGVFANNPSVLAYGEAKELWKQKTSKVLEARVLADDNDLPFYLLSLGTGYHLNSIPVEKAQKWHAASWASQLTDIFMRSVEESTHFTMQHLLPPYTDGSLRYQRLNMNIPEKNKEMDNVETENIDQLCEIAEAYVKKNEVTLLKICEYLY